MTLIGRCTRDAEVRYSQGAQPMAIARFSLAVNRRFKRDGEPDADFFNCVAFGKTGEFCERFMKKGGQFGIVGRLQNRSWEQDGQKRYATDIIAEEIYFAGGAVAEENRKPADPVQNAMGMFPGATVIDGDDDLPW